MKSVRVSAIIYTVTGSSEFVVDEHVTSTELQKNAHKFYSLAYLGNENMCRSSLGIHILFLSGGADIKKYVTQYIL